MLLTRSTQGILLLLDFDDMVMETRLQLPKNVVTQYCSGNTYFGGCNR
jgi:hypothetical protein